MYFRFLICVITLGFILRTWFWSLRFDSGLRSFVESLCWMVVFGCSPGCVFSGFGWEISVVFSVSR